MSDRLDISDVRKRFAQIDAVDARGSRRPHRPLLVLYALGKLEEDVRKLSFEQLDRDFDVILKEFGPPHETSVKYPFWYLRKDDVWNVEDADKLPRRSGKKEPLVSAMRKQNTHGGFSEDVWTVLQENEALRREIAQMMLEKCFPATLHQDILDGVGLNLSPTYYTSKQRKRDPDFRQDVLEAYGRQCAVCGFDLTIDEKSLGLEAAHIRWHQYDGPDVISNGIALCSLHHKMLDRGAVHITAEARLLVAEDVDGSSPHIDRLREKHDRRIRTPERADYMPEEDYATWHVQEVFRGEYSAT